MTQEDLLRSFSVLFGVLLQDPQFLERQERKKMNETKLKLKRRFLTKEYGRGKTGSSGVKWPSLCWWGPSSSQEWVFRRGSCSHCAGLASVWGARESPSESFHLCARPPPPCSNCLSVFPVLPEVSSESQCHSENTTMACASDNSATGRTMILYSQDNN